MIVLGVNAYHGDASAAVVVDGKLVAAVEEERFNRIKHSAGFPVEAVRYCLKEAGIAISLVDYIAIPRDPWARLLNKLYYGLKIPALAMRRYTALRKTQGIKIKLADIFQIDPLDIKADFVNIEHHRAHLAASFFASPFEKALLFSADGLGDFASTMFGLGEANKIKIISDIPFPHSLGMFYTAITQYLGFMNYGDEYKVMGLSAYGRPEYMGEFEKIILKHGNLGFKLGLKYFTHHRKLADMNFEEGYPELAPLYSSYLEKRLGSHREKSSPIEERHLNIAASLQARLEEVVFTLLNELNKLYGLDELCMTGGVAYNCVINGKIFDNTSFKRVYVPPAPGDAGLAIGAALYLWNQLLDKPRAFEMGNAYWGPVYSREEIGRVLNTAADDLNKQGCKVLMLEDKDERCRKTAKEIADGKVVGWFQGKTEWGPRALGNRSILVDPRRAEMKDLLNLRIKHRESFRPFAPSILAERLTDYFEKENPSPFMSFAYRIIPEKKESIPAVVHVDGTSRVQSVTQAASPLYWQLLNEFEKITGVPVLLNTSFNDNEPIVNTPQEAIDCFLRTKMDILVMESYFITK